ncbi:MAG TPA: NUDIX hydrolase, partial [Chryseosolibacter sp.]|nr:NUDIX hydrolase [Chryseosolibacter sp.]
MKQDIKVAVDAVVFGYEAEQGVSVLLIQRKLEPFKGLWALPGGFMKNGESPEDAVSRELKTETGVDVKYLEQLYTFGDPDRDPRFQVLSVSYFALVRPRNVKV